MSIPLHIAFRNMQSSPAAETQVRERVGALERFHPRITACNVMLEARHRHQHQGKLFQVRVDLVVPGGEIVVSRDPGADHAHEDLHVAIRDAFDAARRRLEDKARRLRGDMKTHVAPMIGRIVRIQPEKDHAFLTTESGEEIYLHRNSVVGNGFDALRLGDQVRYVLATDPGEKGQQASTVELLSRHT